MKEEEEENNKDLWETGVFNLLIAPLHIPVLPRQFKVVKEGKGREGKGVKGKERELWCKF
jgi:hypothetical protein